MIQFLCKFIVHFCGFVASIWTANGPNRAGHRFRLSRGWLLICSETLFGKPSNLKAIYWCCNYYKIEQIASNEWFLCYFVLLVTFGDGEHELWSWGREIDISGDGITKNEMCVEPVSMRACLKVYWEMVL